MLINKDILSGLIESKRTPVYIYNRETLSDTISNIKNAFPAENFKMLFATMANDHAEFLMTVRASGVGACVNSIPHLNKVFECGFSADDVQFTSTGIPDQDLDVLAKHRVVVNFDSLEQLERWFKLKGQINAGLRINTSSLSSAIPFADRLGISKNDVNAAMQIAQRHNSKINGLHIYVGTNYKDHIQMLVPLKEFFKLAATIPTLEYVNIGGGIGVDYLGEHDSFDLKSFGSAVTQFRHELDLGLGKSIQLVFEPGRRLAASSGIFVTRITDIKKLNDTRYVVVDASIAVFPRPFHHPESPHAVSTPFNNGQTAEATVVGKTTFSKDIMVRTELPVGLVPGDILVFSQAGAYCDSMRSRFLGQYEPESIFV